MSIKNYFFFTDDCPIEGMWGKGLDCVACPAGGVCPGGMKERGRRTGEGGERGGEGERGEEKRGRGRWEGVRAYV